MWINMINSWIVLFSQSLPINLHYLSDKNQNDVFLYSG